MTEIPPPSSSAAPVTTTGPDPAVESEPRSEIAGYVAEVRAALIDLDADELDDILDDLTSHLADVQATVDGPLVEALGPPRAYAAELRAAAGLPLVPPSPAPPPPVGPFHSGPSAPPGSFGGPDRNVVRADPLTRWVDEARSSARAASEQVRAHQWWHEVVTFLPELRPAWWVARAWLIVVLVASLTSGGSPSGPLWLIAPPVFGNPVLGLAVLAGAVVFSVRRGRSPGPGRPDRRLVRWLVVGAAILGLLFFTTAQDTGPSYDAGFDAGFNAASSQSAGQSFVWSGGDGEGPLNVYAYLPDGTPIDEVLLFDEQGRPLVVGVGAGLPPAGEGRIPYSVEVWGPVLSEQIEVVLPTDADGLPVPNLYPRRLAVTGSDGEGGERRRVLPAPDVRGQFPPTTTPATTTSTTSAPPVTSAPPASDPAGSGAVASTPAPPAPPVSEDPASAPSTTSSPPATDTSAPTPVPPTPVPGGTGTGGGS